MAQVPAQSSSVVLVTVNDQHGAVTAVPLPPHDQLAAGIERFADAVRVARRIGHDPDHELVAGRELRIQHQLARLRAIALTRRATAGDG